MHATLSYYQKFLKFDNSLIWNDFDGASKTDTLNYLRVTKSHGLLINPNTPFLYPLKTLEKHKVF